MSFLFGSAVFEVFMCQNFSSPASFKVSELQALADEQAALALAAASLWEKSSLEEPQRIRITRMI